MGSCSGVRDRARLTTWNLELLDRLDAPETADLLDRLAAHPALEGPERTLLQARLAHRRGDTGRTQKLVRTVLEKLPGHQEALAFAVETGTPLPPSAARVLADRDEYP
jgi:hypothetical protein